MTTSQVRHPVLLCCMHCGDVSVVEKSGEPQVVCRRTRCKKNDATTPIRPIGYIRMPEGVSSDYGNKVLEAIGSGRIPASVLDQYLDPLASYRQIEGLFVIGPAELDRACRSQNLENPLNLKDGWIPQIEVPAKMDEWIRSCVWRNDEEWKTRAALVLVPPKIGGIPTSLIGQNSFWGVGHDGLPAGKVRQDVFWSNWFVKNYDWANVQAVEEWRWLLAYECPLWTTGLTWDKQQEAAKKRGMLILTAAQDAFVLNAVLAATGIRLRATTWSRTDTPCDGYPLFVCSFDYGVSVFQYWDPEESAYSALAASVQGVPL